MKTNLASGLWEDIATSASFIVKNSDLTGDAFFRVLAAERPVVIHVPETYDPSAPSPLIVLLDGYPYSGPWMEDFIGFETTLESLGIISCYPTGAESGHETGVSPTEIIQVDEQDVRLGLGCDRGGCQERHNEGDQGRS